MSGVAARRAATSVAVRIPRSSRRRACPFEDGGVPMNACLPMRASPFAPAHAR